MNARRRALRAAGALCGCAALAGLGRPGIVLASGSTAASLPRPARAGTAATSASRAGPATAAAASPAVLAWGPDGAWIVDDGALREVPAALPPAATAAGVWTVDSRGGVTRWQRATAAGVGVGDWRPAAAHAVGEAVHAVAASADGAHALVAHGERLTLLDAQARPLRTYDGTDLARTRRGRADWLLAHGGRRSLVAGWPALGELWEIPLDPDAPPIFEGLVHDYRTGESLPTRGHLGVRRAPLGRPMPRWGWADDGVPWLAGQVDDAVAIVHLDVRRRIATLPMPSAQLPAAAVRTLVDRREWWLPVGDAVYVVDPARWTVSAQRPRPVGLVALHAIGDALWALGDEGLQRWDGAGWRILARLPGGPCALAHDSARDHWLVATGGPAALLRLDAEGRPLVRLAWPKGARIDGLAAIG